MRGLDPRIHAFVGARRVVGGRVEPGHDGFIRANARFPVPLREGARGRRRSDLRRAVPQHPPVEDPDPGGLAPPASADALDLAGDLAGPLMPVQRLEQLELAPQRAHRRMRCLPQGDGLPRTQAVAIVAMRMAPRRATLAAMQAADPAALDRRLAAAQPIRLPPGATARRAGRVAAPVAVPQGLLGGHEVPVGREGVPLWQICRGLDHGCNINQNGYIATMIVRRLCLTTRVTGLTFVPDRKRGAQP